MKYGRSLQELAIELDRQAKVKKDYRRSESEDYWLWARAFFDAPIFDLQAIAALVQ